MGVGETDELGEGSVVGYKSVQGQENVRRWGISCVWQMQASEVRGLSMKKGSSR